MADRVRFHLADARHRRAGGYDLVVGSSASTTCPTRCRCWRPCGGWPAADGAVLVMDERVAERFTAPGDEIEQLMYGYSLLRCLPDGLAHPDPVGTGTVMRPDTLRDYAAVAGFAGVDVPRRSSTTSSASTGCGDPGPGPTHLSSPRDGVSGQIARSPPRTSARGALGGAGGLSPSSVGGRPRRS